MVGIREIRTIKSVLGLSKKRILELIEKYLNEKYQIFEIYFQIQMHDNICDNIDKYISFSSGEDIPLIIENILEKYDKDKITYIRLELYKDSIDAKNTQDILLYLSR